MNKESNDLLEAKESEVDKHIGALEEATKQLENDSDECEATQEEVGSWITTIGKAIVGIFKP